MAGEKENFKKRRSIAYVNAAERLHRAANDRGSMYIPGEDVYYGMQLPEVEVTSTRRGTGTSDTRHPVFETTSVPGWGITNSRNSWEQGRYSPVENVNPEFYTLAPALGVEDYLAGKAIGKGISNAAKYVAPTIKKAIIDITDHLPTSPRRARYYAQRGKQDLILALNSDAYKDKLTSDGFPFSDFGYMIRNLDYPGEEIAKKELQDFIDAQTKNILDTKVHAFYNPIFGRHLAGLRTFYNGKNNIYINTIRHWAKNDDSIWNTAVHEATHASKGKGYQQSNFPMSHFGTKSTPAIKDQTDYWSSRIDLSRFSGKDLDYVKYLLEPDELRARVMTHFVSDFKNKNKNSLTDDMDNLCRWFGKDYVLNGLTPYMYRKGGRRSLEN